MSTDALFSVDLAAASSNRLDHILSSILAIFGGILQVSILFIPCLYLLPRVKGKVLVVMLSLAIPNLAWDYLTSPDAFQAK